MNLGVVRLVAAREIKEGFRSKGYWIAGAIAAVVTVAFILVPQLPAFRSQTTTTVGVVGDLSDVERRMLAQSAAYVRAPVTYRTVESRDAAAVALQAGDIDVAIIDAQELLVDRPIGGEGRSSTGRAATALSIALALRPEGPLPVNALRPPIEPVVSNTDVFVGLYGGLLIFFFVLSYGGWVHGGVTDEKQNRVVEVLLSTVRPQELIVGKVLGIGAAALLQGGLTMTAALATAFLSGNDVIRGTTVKMAAAVMTWFILGSALYLFAYAAAGSLASRPEEARATQAPVMMPLMASWMIASFSASGTVPSQIVMALSMFPPTAPILMPFRVGLGTATPSQFLIAVGLALAAIAGTAWVASRIYRNSVLNTGRKVGVLEAWRAG